MEKLFLTALLMGMSASGLHAQKTTVEPTFTEWHDLQVNAVNRLQRIQTFLRSPQTTICVGQSLI